MNQEPAFRIDPVPDDPGDLRIALREREGEVLKLWLPENIWRDPADRPELPRPTAGPIAHDTYAVLGFENEEWQATPWERTAAGGLTRVVGFADGEVRASATPVGDDIALELAVTNRTSEPWYDCWAEVCLRLATSPSFADPLRERTLGRIDGRWTSLESTPLCTPDPTHNSYLTTPPVEFVKRCARDWWCDEFPVQLDHPLIAVHDRYDRGVLGIVFEPCAEYCNNLEPDYACIHSDPLLGDVEPSETAVTRGKIVYVRASREAFLAHASDIRPGAD